MSDHTNKSDIFEKIKNRALDAEKRLSNSKSHLSPQKHKQLDFFIADMFDTVSFRDDIASMEYPIFALKAGDTRTRYYEHNNFNLTIRATELGLATVHDKDIWIYCISKLMQAIHEGEEISRTIRFTTYDFLVSTNRDIGGRQYELLKDSLERLSGTRLTTSLNTGGITDERGFGLIDSWRIIKEDGSGRMVNLELTLPDWLYRSIMSKEVLTISSDYFRLRKPLDRRIYELARKHCGHQKEWKISLNLLHKKTGSTANIRKFRMNLKSLAESNELPDYFVEFCLKKDMVLFKNRNSKALTKDLFNGNH